MSVLFDTHIHLSELDDPCAYFERYGAFSVSISPADWPAQLTLLTQTENTDFKVGLGLHPWHLHTHVDDWADHLAFLETMLIRYPTVHIGEIGLDFDRRTPADHGFQCVVFEQCLDLAHRYGRTVSVHVRKAYDEAFRLLRQYPGVKTFLHGFGGGVQQAERFLSALEDSVIGVNGVVVRANARRYHEMIRHVGLTRLVLETDGPFVTLPGHEAFELDDLTRVCDHVASLLGKSPAEVAERTRANAMRMFSHAG